MSQSAQLFATMETGGRPCVSRSFIGKDPDSNPTGSSTVYRTDRCSWVVRGWVVTDPEALVQMDMSEGETCVEIPRRMIHFFGQGDRGVDNG
jgi:hypothetical protein